MGTGFEDPKRQVGGRSDDVLAVVEHDQHAPIGHEPGDGVQRRLGGRLPHAQDAGDLGRHRRRVVDGRQLDERHAVEVALDPVGGGVHGEPRLADPRCAGEGDEPVGVQRLGDRRQLGGAADQRRRLVGQVVPVGVERAQRRELAGEVGVGELVHLLGPHQVGELVAPQIDQTGAVGEPVEHQIRRGPRHDHLPAVGAVAQPGAAVERGAGVVALAAQHDLAGVHGHPYPQRGAVGPWFGLQRPLGVEGGGDAVGRALEGRHRRIAVALLDRRHTTMGGDGRTEQGVVTDHRRNHLVRGVLPARRRGLDIGEHERHRPRRQAGRCGHQHEVSRLPHPGDLSAR